MKRVRFFSSFQIHHSPNTNRWHLLKFPVHTDRSVNAMSICAKSVIFFFFEALLKAITIGVESTHDNWFAGSK